MRLTLTRTERSGRSTLGELEINGEPFCRTLEDPVRPYRLPGITAIPAGTYPVQITWSPRFKARMPLLIGVPGFSGVRIHPGSAPEHGDGSILVGTEQGIDEIRRSEEAYDELFRQLDEAIHVDGSAVTIEIIDAVLRA